MKHVYQPIEKYSGPWFLTKSQLLSLDTTLRNIQDEFLSTACKKCNQMPYIKVIVSCESGRIYGNNKFEGIIHESSIRIEKVVSIVVEIKPEIFCMSCHESIDVHLRWRVSKHLELECRSVNHLADSVINRIKSWIEVNEPTFLDKLFWTNGPSIMLSMIVVIVLYLGYSILKPTEYDPDKIAIVNSIIETGINDTNRDQALSLLVEAQFGKIKKYIPAVTVESVQYSIRALIYVTCVFVSLLIAQKGFMVEIGKWSWLVRPYKYIPKLILLLTPIWLIQQYAATYLL